MTHEYAAPIRQLIRCWVAATLKSSFATGRDCASYLLFLFWLQSLSLGLGEQWEQVKAAYAQANRALGDIVKVGLGLPMLTADSCLIILTVAFAFHQSRKSTSAQLLGALFLHVICASHTGTYQQ